jgi:hypothetical protein
MVLYIFVCSAWNVSFILSCVCTYKRFLCRFYIIQILSGKIYLLMLLTFIEYYSIVKTASLSPEKGAFINMYVILNFWIHVKGDDSCFWLIIVIWYAVIWYVVHFIMQCTCISISHYLIMSKWQVFFLPQNTWIVANTCTLDW